MTWESLCWGRNGRMLWEPLKLDKEVLETCLASMRLFAEKKLEEDLTTRMISILSVLGRTECDAVNILLRMLAFRRLVLILVVDLDVGVIFCNRAENAHIVFTKWRALP